MEKIDLAKKEHWDQVYESLKPDGEDEWTPASHEDLALEYMLSKEIERHKPENILEIGCGNSVWLPYLAKNKKLEVFGLDYSEEGCRLAKERMIKAGVCGTVYCSDLFEADPGQIGTYDFVYSLGVVEHFKDLENVLLHMLKFVRPGGVLLTEIPNLHSMHGILMWIYQPDILAKHLLLTKRRMEVAYRSLPLKEISSEYLGLFSIGIVSWGFSPRFPRMDKIVLPVMKKIRSALQIVMRRIRFYKGISIISPFIYISGIKE